MIATFLGMAILGFNPNTAKAYEKYYVADESDVNNPEFYWHYQFPY